MAEQHNVEGVAEDLYRPPDKMHAQKHRHLAFADSPEWQDYRAAVRQQVAVIGAMLEGAESWEKVCRLQGSVQAMRWFLELPEEFAKMEKE